MLQQKIDHINSVIYELEELKSKEKINGKTKIYGQGISISLTSDLSEAISNYYAKNEGKTFKETTVDELIGILNLDIEEKKELLKKEKEGVI
ncbi:MAG: hypothetical protein PHR61_03390 [Candidatus Absconditabacteria bacterium]|nr:hypothetical protein [Candidatus Absconditabacteria bacterium]